MDARALKPHPVVLGRRRAVDAEAVFAAEILQRLHARRDGVVAVVERPAEDENVEASAVVT